MALQTSDFDRTADGSHPFLGLVVAFAVSGSLWVLIGVGVIVAF